MGARAAGIEKLLEIVEDDGQPARPAFQHLFVESIDGNSVIVRRTTLPRSAISRRRGTRKACAISSSHITRQVTERLFLRGSHTTTIAFDVGFRPLAQSERAAGLQQLDFRRAPKKIGFVGSP